MRTKSEIYAACLPLANEAARIIGSAAWYEQAPKVLTDAERLEVRELWDSMPGYTCWMDAFFGWYELLPDETRAMP